MCGGGGERKGKETDREGKKRKKVKTANKTQMKGVASAGGSHGCGINDPGTAESDNAGPAFKRACASRSAQRNREGLISSNGP